MNRYLTYSAIILLSAIAYGILTRTHSFDVMPDDYNEYTVKCGLFTMDVYQDGKPMFTSSDTADVIDFILREQDGLGIWVYRGECGHFEPDRLFATKVIYQMVEGAPCYADDKLIAFY